VRRSQRSRAWALLRGERSTYTKMTLGRVWASILKPRGALQADHRAGGLTEGNPRVVKNGQPAQAE